MADEIRPKAPTVSGKPTPTGDFISSYRHLLFLVEIPLTESVDARWVSLFEDHLPTDDEDPMEVEPFNAHRSRSLFVWMRSERERRDLSRIIAAIHNANVTHEAVRERLDALDTELALWWDQEGSKRDSPPDLSEGE